MSRSSNPILAPGRRRRLALVAVAATLLSLVGLGAPASASPVDVEVGADGRAATAAAPARVFQNAMTFACLDVVGGSSQARANVQQFFCHEGPNQQWRLVPVPGSSGYYQFVNVRSGHCLDVANASRADQANVQQWYCKTWTTPSAWNQHWRLRYHGNGEYSIVNRNSGRCLDIPDGRAGNHVNVQQYRCHGGDNQRFYLR